MYSEQEIQIEPVRPADISEGKTVPAVRFPLGAAPSRHFMVWR